MVDDPRDPVAYRIAITLLGSALVAAIVGIAWVCAEHRCVRNIPEEIWFLGAATGGVFVGALIPIPMPRMSSLSAGEKAIFAVVVVVLIALGLVCWTLAVAAVRAGWIEWSILGVATGSLLLGLPIPSPGRRS